MKRHEVKGNGRTTCCDAFTTYCDGGVLVCKKCYNEITPDARAPKGVVVKLPKVVEPKSRRLMN